MSSYRFMHDRDIFRSDGAYPDKDPRDWVVIGWFTPDYRTLAEAFSVNLDRLDVPYHLFAKPIGEGWDTSRKPTVVLEAMNLYRGKTIILMDVDCIVEGDLAPLAHPKGDVAFSLIPRRVGPKKHVRLSASSRVMVFQPTDRARRFAQAWERLCGGDEPNDEVNLVYCALGEGDIHRTQIDQHYAGWEIGNKSAPEGTVIWHKSAHAAQQPWDFKRAMQILERPFRRGRAKARKAAGQLMLVKGNPS